MKRLIVILTALAAALALTAAALAASQNHLPGGYHLGGTGSSSYYASYWVVEGTHADGYVDRTVTLIDNVGYGWHGTMRSDRADFSASWYSNTVKKGYCALHQSGAVGCTVFSL